MGGVRGVRRKGGLVERGGKHSLLPLPSHTLPIFLPFPYPPPFTTVRQGASVCLFLWEGWEGGGVKSSEVQCDVSCRELTFGQQNHWLLAQIERAVLNC